MKEVTLFLTLLPFFLSANGYMTEWSSPNKLQPVQSLYIRPSADGTTGDLFVAASENHGISSQWMADQAINFLPNQAQNGHIPLTYTSSISSTKTPGQEVVASQKSTVLSSPPISYTYPAEQAGVPYPYTMPATPQCIETSNPAAVQYPEYPYPYNYYPYLMSAMSASAAHALRDAGLTNDLKELTKALSSYSASYPSYAYNWPYYMVNPQAWVQSQGQPQGPAALTTTTPAPSSTTPSQELDSADEDFE